MSRRHRGRSGLSGHGARLWTLRHWLRAIGWTRTGRRRRGLLAGGRTASRRLEQRQGNGLLEDRACRSRTRQRWQDGCGGGRPVLRDWTCRRTVHLRDGAEGMRCRLRHHGSAERQAVRLEVDRELSRIGTDRGRTDWADPEAVRSAVGGEEGGCCEGERREVARSAIARLSAPGMRGGTY